MFLVATSVLLPFASRVPFFICSQQRRGTVSIRLIFACYCFGNNVLFVFYPGFPKVTFAFSVVSNLCANSEAADYHSDQMGFKFRNILLLITNQMDRKNPKSLSENNSNKNVIFRHTNLFLKTTRNDTVWITA